MVRILLFLCFFSFPMLEVLPQKEEEGRGREEQLEKQAEKDEEREEAIEEGKERHKEIQSKRTKKDLKRLNRKSGRWNESKREFFLVRWYKRVRYELRKK